MQFLDFRLYKGFAGNMAAADVIVLPNTGIDEFSTRFTSPLKLFTYMKNEIPIVASDLQSIREVVDERTAYLVPSDDALAFGGGIEDALIGGNARAQEALKRIEEYLMETQCRAHNRSSPGYIKVTRRSPQSE
ncbi:glycosyltransferase [Patescibacteria group bacterium]|nr:MAG: glycosyltransferase [Patescibacteria group bacterium]